MSTLTIVADDNNLCGEAPIWDDGRKQLYWSDCVGLKFFRYDWLTNQRELVKAGVEVNGCALHQAGGFVITNNSGVWLWDGADNLQLAVSEVEGSECRLNDCIADPKGRLLAGSLFYDASTRYPLGKLFCVDTDGSARVLDEGFHLANGLGFSADNKTLYFTDSAQRMIFAYDYDVQSGTVNRRRRFVAVPADRGLPDGLTVDAEGFIWSAQWYGSCVERYDPDGRLERSIAIPAKQTSSVMFGGPELQDIFITSAARSEPMPIMPRGYDAHSGYFGGALYRLNVGIRGKAEFRASIRVSTGVNPAVNER